jgi:hypothetical protein
VPISEETSFINMWLFKNGCILLICSCFKMWAVGIFGLAKIIYNFMILRKALVVVCLAILSATGWSQEHPSFTTGGKFLGRRPSLAELQATGKFIEGSNEQKEFNPKRMDANRTIPGKGLPIDGDPLMEKQLSSNKLPVSEPILVFDAVLNSNSTPTDPTGAVGPDHYMNAWNSSFRIWDKDGNALVNAASLANIWPGESSGDPIVMYDRFADRFFISQFSFNNSFLCAVSEGPDPVNDGWYTYEFGVNSFPDYPKYSVWSDGYYITANKNSNTAGTSQVVYAIEREQMLIGANAQMAGFPLPNIVTSGFYSPLGFNANGTVAPEPGNVPIIYLQDDNWNGVNQDHLKIWNINVNWDNINSSTISSPQIINTEDFDSVFDGGAFDNLPSPGADLDALQATIMYMAQYRVFPSYNACVLNFVVDLDGGDDYAGIRWFELRQDAAGEPWSIFQEGTYVQPDGLSAWCGSICMDQFGNIALGYTAGGPDDHASLRYTGRFSTDPLGTMTVEEGLIKQGTSSPDFFRYGDYAQLTVDPIDDCTFWHIGELFIGGQRRNTVGVFKIGASLSDDVGVISIDTPDDGALTATEVVTVTLRNYGLDSQSNFPVSYQLDNGTIVSETYAGTLTPGQVAPYTFVATADLSTPGQVYNIWAATGLVGDENMFNDTATRVVTHVNPDDIGVTAIISPVSGTGLGAGENVTVTIENFGSASHTNFEVTYEFNGGAAVTETVTQTLNPLSTISYTFDATVDFGNPGDYTLSVYTSLPGDIDTGNDEVSTVVTKEFCQPGSDCGFGDGFLVLTLESINNNSGCDPTGYGDYTNLSTALSQGITYDMTVTTGYGDQFVRVWIDYNDNFVFENNEITVDNYVIAPGMADGSYTETMDFEVASNAALGEHLMRAKTNWLAEVTDNSCDENQYGETEDYTVEIGNVGVEDQVFQGNDLIIITNAENQYTISLNAPGAQKFLVLRVFDITGRCIVENKVYSQDDKFSYPLDMSYAAKGQYLIRMGTYDQGKIGKIMVK